MTKNSSAAGPWRARWYRFTEGAGAFLVYTLVSLVYWRPIWRLWRERIAPDPYDPIYLLYVLDWVERQIRLGLPDLYGATFFHPLEAPLLLSDHLIGLAAQSLALDLVTGGNSIANYNLLVFLAFPLSAIAAAAVARAAGLSRFGAFVAGAVYAFAPYHWSQLSHLQVLTYQWIPPTLWFFDRLLTAPRWRTAGAFLLFYVLLVTGGNYLAFMVHVPLAALLVHHGLSPPGWRAMFSRRRLAVLAPTALAAIAVTTALFLPYALASGEMGLSWRADNFQRYGATLPSLLTPSQYNLHFELVAPLLRPLGDSYEGHLWFAEKSLFLGFLPLVLVGFGLRRVVRRRRSMPWPRVAVAAGTAALALWLAADLFTLGRWPEGLPEAFGKPGRVYTLLGFPLLAILLSLAWRSRRGRTPPPWEVSTGATWERGLMLAGSVCLLLCFPVFYEPLAHLVPGFSGMRVPTRFFPFALFALAHLAGRGAEALARRSGPPRWSWAAAAGLALLLLAELAPRPIPWHPVPRTDPPAVVRWLAEAEDVNAVLHLPLRADPVDEIERMDLSTLHWQPIVNGYSGHVPRHWEELRRICCWPVPDPKVLAKLRAWEVSHLVVHPRWRRRWERREYREWATAVVQGEVPGVELVWSDPQTGDTVFAIGPAPEQALAEGAGAGGRPAAPSRPLR